MCCIVSVANSKPEPTALESKSSHKSLKVALESDFTVLCYENGLLKKIHQIQEK